MQAYTAKPVHFSDVTRLDSLFEIIATDKNKAPAPTKLPNVDVGSYCMVSGHASGYQSLWVRPTARVLQAIAESMIAIDGGVFFECVIRDDGSCLVVCKYNQILGSRWLALIPASELDRFGWKEGE